MNKHKSMVRKVFKRFVPKGFRKLKNLAITTNKKRKAK